MKSKYVAGRPCLDAPNGAEKQATNTGLPRLVKAGVLDQPDHRYEWRSYWPAGAGQKTNGTGVQIGPEYIGVALIRDADIIGAR